MADGGVSPGEAGGLFAGVVAVLTLLGGGVKWIAGWVDRGRQTREQKLQAWQDELRQQAKDLDEGRTAYTKSLEQRMAVLEANDEARDIQMRALRLAFELVSSALRHLDPAPTGGTGASEAAQKFEGSSRSRK